MRAQSTFRVRMDLFGLVVVSAEPPIDLVIVSFWKLIVIGFSPRRGWIDATRGSRLR